MDDPKAPTESIEEKTEPTPDYFAIDPKLDCPHVSEANMKAFAHFLKGTLQDYQKKAKDNVFSRMECSECKNSKENWICLECSKIFCSRYVSSHMVEHNKETKHPVAFSFSDGSFWCYECDSYITSVELGLLRRTFGFIKHKLDVGKGDLREGDIVYDILQELAKLNQGEDTFTRAELIEGLKEKRFKNIVGITGAGISVAAGIPDFRSQGGLYHKLAEKYGLKHPEEIMTIQFFKENPEPLYAIMKEFLSSKVKPFNYKIVPTLCHKFFADMAKRGQLLKYYTQNIDGLEKEAGLGDEYMIQAHGHIRSCSCSMCASNILMTYRGC